MSSAREIWVGGFPSTYGGADTELDHLINLWRAFGVEVNLVPMFGADGAMMESVLARGCRVHEYHDAIFADRIVASFCNGEFLRKLPAIVAAGRPRCTIWFNCMTWLFETEKELHRQGLIDVFGFVSDYQKAMLLPQLTELGPVRSFDYRPYFDTTRVAWRYREWAGCYRLGRISRDDGAKFPEDMWGIFDRVLVPQELAKKVYVLGFGANAHNRAGSAPPGLDWQTWLPNQITATDFYRTIDTMIHKTGGSRESYGRVLVEAYAHGVVPIVERDYAFPSLVVHGETGFLCSTSDEMSYYASWLAMHPDEHRRIAENGRIHLEQSVADPQSCWRGWSALFDAYDAAAGIVEVALHIVSAPAPAVVDAHRAIAPPLAGRRPRVLAFTCSRGRHLMLRNCILQLGSQSYPADHAVYVNGSDDSRALYADLGRPGLFIRFGPTLSQHKNHVEALSVVNIQDYDLFCKVDDDDLYRLDYIASVVASFEAHGWDYSGTFSEGLIKGSDWYPSWHLKSLGLYDEDQALGVIEVMPSSTAYSRRAIARILTLDCGGFEDVEWRRALASAGFSLAVRDSSSFVYNIHGNNISTGRWLDVKQNAAVRG